VQYRFHLRTLTAVVLAASVLSFALRSWRMHALAQETIVRRVHELGGSIVLECELDASAAKPRWIPRVLLDLLGPHYFSDVAEVAFQADNFAPVDVTDSDLQDIAALSSLRTLIIAHGRHVTDNGVRSITGLADLSQLELSGCSISDEALLYISQLRRLEALNLNRNSVGDVGLEHLWQLSNLRELHMLDTNISAAGVAALQSHLENVRVDWMDRTIDPFAPGE
jgi:hypothetical protein